jgi:UDP-N-acetylmuramate--alanine ligase
MDFLDAKRVHVIGIGGIGTSGLSKILVHRGVVVSGSDASASLITEDLSVRGVAVTIGHSADNVAEDVDAIVYSSAVPATNPERAAAEERGIPQFSYSVALGAITRKYRTIAVSGTHGKSTTTSMLATILIAAGLEPLVLVGTRVPNFKDGNVYLGAGDIFVVEACEHEAQMMNLSPERIVITNLEPDHLDFYGTFENLSETFKKYVAQIPAEHCVVNGDEASVVALFGDEKPVTFGFENTDVQCTERHSGDGIQYASVAFPDGAHADLKLRIPGAFNVMNALAATTMAMQVGVSAEQAFEALYNFPGSWRRFERVGHFNGAPVISDYGHHPTAIRETVKAAREFFPGKRVVLAYQPHQHHRTKALYGDFIEALADPDALILNEVYHVTGREDAKDAATTSEGLMGDVAARRGEKPHWYAKSLDEVSELIQKHALPDDIILVMGAGDIYKIAHKVCSI